MSTEDDLDRPLDPDGPHGRWWEDVYTLGWAAQRHDSETVGLDQRVTAVIDLLIGRCSAQLHPRDRTAAPRGEAAERIMARQHHLSKVRDSIVGNTTVAEVRRLLEVYGPLARATHHDLDDLDDPEVDEQLDRLANPPA